jgi:protein-S-isoprenylcysteine O-methyltransferase Ste14
MDTVRIALVAGLVLHKAVWEWLKRQGGAQPVQERTEKTSLLKRTLKLAKLAFLMFLVLQTCFLRIFPISGQPAGLQGVGMALYLVGLATAIGGRLQLGQNWANLEDYRVLAQQALVTKGIYRYIRHPIYAGDALLLVGLQLALNSWLVLAMLVPVAVFVRQSMAEEILLARTLPGYADYRTRTKRYIPFLV